jgi:hypothetical protein
VNGIHEVRGSIPLSSTKPPPSGYTLEAGVSSSDI